MVSLKESFQPFLQQRNGVCFPGKTLFPWAPDRIFKSGEMLCWDEKHPAKLILFASGGLQWQPEDVVQFTQSMERVVPPPT